MDKFTWRIGKSTVKGYFSGTMVELVFLDENKREHRKRLNDKNKVLAHKEDGKLVISKALSKRVMDFYSLHHKAIKKKTAHKAIPTFLIDEDDIRITGKIFGNIVKFTLINKEGVRHSGVLKNVEKKTLESKTKLKQRVLAHVNEMTQGKRSSNLAKRDDRKNIRGGSALDSTSDNYASIPTYFNQTFKESGKKKKEVQEVHSDRHYSREPDVVSIGDSITFMKDGHVRTKVLDEDENYPSYLKKLLGHRLNEVVDGMKIISIEK